MAQEVKPTRSELLKLKKQIKLAKSGHSLLKKKRDGLIMEFFALLKKSKTARADLAKAFAEAQEKVTMARVVHTDLRLHSLGLAITQSPEIDLETKNIMGVKVPKIQSKSHGERTMTTRGMGVLASSPLVDQVIEAYEKVVENIIVVAEVETAMKRLLQEIDKTKRRVNALEFVKIPELQSIERYIKAQLAEIERETFTRLKNVKRKLQAQQAA